MTASEPEGAGDVHCFATLRKATEAPQDEPHGADSSVSSALPTLPTPAAYSGERSLKRASPTYNFPVFSQRTYTGRI